MVLRTVGGSVVAAVAIALGGSAYGQTAVQWRVEDGGNGHWYLPTVDVFPDFWSSQQFAVQRGAHLVTLTSAAENEFVASLAPGDFMLGGYQDLAAPDYVEPSGAWKWVTGEPWEFNAWNSYWVDEPNNGGSPGLEGEHYLQWWRFGDPWRTRWNDGGNDFVSNWWNRPAILEWSADCNGDGIVDYGQCRDGSLPDYDGDNIPDCCEAGTPCTVANYPVQWRVEDGGNGHWYATFPRNDRAWVDCLPIAVGRGGYLATVTSSLERLFTNAVRRDQAAVLGAFQDTSSPSYVEPAGGWRWVTDEPWDYTAWFPGGERPEPNDWSIFGPENWLTCGYSAGEWNDGPFNVWWTTVVLLEWSADCDADGVVDYGQILRGEVSDVNGNGIPDTCDCPADINQSGTIDAEDLAYVLFAWGMPGSKAGGADINGDATVDANDLSLVLGSWGPCPN